MGPKAGAQGQRAAGQQKRATGGGHIYGPWRPFEQPQPGGLELALQRTSPEQPEAGGCELAQSRKSTGLEATSNYACVSRGRREQQIALIWDTQGKHSWLKLSTIFDATEYSPPWLAKALPRIFNPSHTSCTSPFTRPIFIIWFSLPRHQQVSSSPQSHGLHSRAPRTGSRLGRALPHSSHATRPPRPAPLLSPRAPRACEPGPRFTRAHSPRAPRACEPGPRFTRAHGPHL